MLYIFAGFPGKDQPLSLQPKGLHAGGLQYCIEEVEGLAELDHVLDYRKEGVFIGDSKYAEWLCPVDYRISEKLLRDGITWGWFPETFGFGNGVTHHVTLAGPEFKTVVYGSDLNLDEFVATRGIVKFSEIEMKRRHMITDGWSKYAERWSPMEKCPVTTHQVHLTWLVTTHELPEFAYSRIRDIIENGAQLVDPHRYHMIGEPGKYSSGVRVFGGKPAFGVLTK